MLDSGVAGILLVGEQQVIALQKKDLTVKINTLATNNNIIRFRKGTATIKGIIRVTTLIGTITFYVVPINTPFLLCL